jgi:uncharacterized membrane protein YdbT with pleckstrin-like domain
MNYVRRVLQPGETVVHLTRIHPIIFLTAMLWFVAAVALLIASLTVQGDLHIGAEALAIFCLIFALVSALPALVRRLSTELVVTDRRVIYKSGVLARHSLEMNRSKVESVDVDQPFLGRIFGYGTIILRGTGSTFQPIYHIADPLTFRSHITAG